MKPSSDEVSYFGPGPAKIPKKVLTELQPDLLDYKPTSISVLELSHRSAEFGLMLADAHQLVKTLLDVPDNYKIIFVQGGGNGQFAAVPLNLMSKTGHADYHVTGVWSAKAADEAKKFGKVNLLAAHTKEYRRIAQHELQFSENASYVYYCDNETVDGLEFSFIPSSPYNVPIVCDMSSNIFSRKVDIKKFGVIFGSAQKNIGTAGVTVVIVREDLLGMEYEYCPSILSYSKMANAKSLLNTPPVFAIHVLRRILQHVKDQGGIPAMEQNSKEKSTCLYKCIDSSNGFYRNMVENHSRSRMNVVFRVGGNMTGGNEDLEKKFVEEATKANLLSLKGHRSVGGIRVSIYNAVTIEDVTKLVSFMVDFRSRNIPE